MKNINATQGAAACSVQAFSDIWEGGGLGETKAGKQQTAQLSVKQVGKYDHENADYIWLIIM